MERDACGQRGRVKSPITEGRPEHAGKAIPLSGRGLTINQLVTIARYGATVELGSGVEKQVDASRAALERILQNNELIYGVNTGFGANVKFGIPASHLDAHQLNLLRFLCCGAGAPFSVEVTRAAMVLRVNALSNGFSAIRLSVLKALCGL